MNEIYTNTLKYFRVAINEYLHEILALKRSTKDSVIKEELTDLSEAYIDIARKIDTLNLNYNDLNKIYANEPFEVQNYIPEFMLENLSRLALRLLDRWKSELKRLESKKYHTDRAEKEIKRLSNLIWPLEEIIEDKERIIGKYKSKGPLVFPGEDKESIKTEITKSTKENVEKVFPQALIDKIPTDIAKLCEEFNFNYTYGKPNASILLLRRILPLSIVRKFQQLGKEAAIKDKNGEYHDTKKLLGKIETHLKHKKIYKELLAIKILVDSAQHSYSLNIDLIDVKTAAIVIRLFLDDIF